MATSSFDSVFRFGCTTIAIPVGVTTNAVYFGLEPNLVRSTIEYVGAGGSLIAIGVNYGATLAGATLASAGYYQVDPVSPFVIEGPACFYLAALGATAVASVRRDFNQGASFAP